MSMLDLLIEQYKSDLGPTNQMVYFSGMTFAVYLIG